MLWRLFFIYIYFPFFSQSQSYRSGDPDNFLARDFRQSCSTTRITKNLCGQRSFCSWCDDENNAQRELLDRDAQQRCSCLFNSLVGPWSWSYCQFSIKWKAKSSYSDKGFWMGLELVHISKYVWQVGTYLLVTASYLHAFHLWQNAVSISSLNSHLKLRFVLSLLICLENIVIISIALWIICSRDDRTVYLTSSGSDEYGLTF